MNGFDTGLLGGPAWLEAASGARIALPAERWHAAPADGDELLLGACTGPTVDIGCGPGRLSAALGDLGVPVLGVDSSPVAVDLTRRRGAPVVLRNVFESLPAEGRWRHALLADGNIGIGGDPVGLLHRVARLLAPGGSALVELDPPGGGLRRGRARVSTGESAPGTWFDWAWVAADAAPGLASDAGLRLDWVVGRGGRWFAEFRKPGRASDPPGDAERQAGS
ncbi:MULTISPECIES: methyltransferase domain-containing protein [Prauserella salsuginis group]|uniref:SAM-dependent methyltransferase n=2 Tax=Prauserella salsuginis group TaxID=2893672 RepID=A0A839XR15_9PSEU|nr:MULTISPECIES: class I SAM-dependent methyltransferase [Prauserella salsuginis group]MBB3665650.1 SAM-dependent methyltransferase [Prauserella sediminis]MCR3718082.1 Methyltransferase domain-containing protein [Prauserella flava]MCR3732652.1 Methyltransferase domain-containing protein [Prauserella salsuginis]